MDRYVALSQNPAYIHIADDPPTRLHDKGLVTRERAGTRLPLCSVATSRAHAAGIGHCCKRVTTGPRWLAQFFPNWMQRDQLLDQLLQRTTMMIDVLRSTCYYRWAAEPAVRRAAPFAFRVLPPRAARG